MPAEIEVNHVDSPDYGVLSKRFSKMTPYADSARMMGESADIKSGYLKSSRIKQKSGLLPIVDAYKKRSVNIEKQNSISKQMNAKTHRNRVDGFGIDAITERTELNRRKK